MHLSTPSLVIPAPKYLHSQPSADVGVGGCAVCLQAFEETALAWQLQRRKGGATVASAQDGHKDRGDTQQQREVVLCEDREANPSGWGHTHTHIHTDSDPSIPHVIPHRWMGLLETETSDEDTTCYTPMHLSTNLSSREEESVSPRMGSERHAGGDAGEAEEKDVNQVQDEEGLGLHRRRETQVLEGGEEDSCDDVGRRRGTGERWKHGQLEEDTGEGGRERGEEREGGTERGEETGEEGCCKRAEERTRKREERGREKGRVENKDRDEKEREDTGTKELDKAMLERILCVRSGARYRRMLPRCFEAWLFRVFLRASRTHGDVLLLRITYT